MSVPLHPVSSAASSVWLWPISWIAQSQLWCILSAVPRYTLMTQSPRRSCPHLFLNGQLQQPDWSCCSGSNAHCYTQSHLLEHWWHYQQVAVVHGLICMDKPDTPIDLIIQRLRWSCVSKSLQQPDWCSCPNLVLNGRLQQADWSCCSENTAHWKTDDIINKWHLSIAWMEKPDTSISTTVQGLKWSCMSKSLQDWWPSWL